MQTINTYYEDRRDLDMFICQHKHILFSTENTSILVQVFCGKHEYTFIETLITDILSVLPMACIVGTTASGEIMNGEVSGQKTVLSFSAFQKTTLHMGSFLNNTPNDIALGRSIAATLGSDSTKALILFGAGNLVHADQVLKGIEAEYPQMLVVGGNAGDNSTMNSAFVFCNQKIIDRGFIGVSLDGEGLEAQVYSLLGWKTIGKEMTITKVKKRRVYTIDNIPACQVYRQYLGIDKIGNFLNVVEFPLILTRNNITVARTPRIHYKDDSIGFAGEFIQGEKVRLSFGDPGLITEETEALCGQIRRKNADSIFVYSCESRRGFLQDLSDIETRPLQKIAPTSGFFTAGEYYHYRGTNQLLNATMTLLVLAESGKEMPKEKLIQEENSCSCMPQPLCPDSIKERRSGVLKALTHLINTVTAELETANKELQYIGLHDSMTGVHNRTYFEQEMKRLDTLDDEAVGIIICDMDYLKLLNDSVGHEFGDKMLMLCACILQESCRQEDAVARIGGDEFAILVRDATGSLLKSICTRILEKVRQARELREGNLLYLSVGFAHREKHSNKNLKEVFKIADTAMYQYKLEQKEPIRKEIIETLLKINGGVWY